MIQEYVDAALKRARYRRIEDEAPYFAEIPACRGVWATGTTLAECRKNLREALEGWILVSLRKGLPLPRFQGRELRPARKVPVHA